VQDTTSKAEATEEAIPKGGRRRSEVTEKQASRGGGGGGGGGGWMTVSDAKAPSRAPVEDVDEDQVQPAANKDKHFQDNDEIVVIPDLDEDGGGDSDQRIARAPRNVTRKIPTLADLESEVKAAIPQSEGGFDLSVLLNTLVPPQQVQEGDEHWTFESLLRDVTDELMVPSKTVLEASILPSSPVSAPAAEKIRKEKKK